VYCGYRLTTISGADMITGRTEEEKMLFQKVRSYGQEHILRFWDEIDEKGKNALVDDIKKVDFHLIEQIKPLLTGKAIHTRRVKKPNVIFTPMTEEKRIRRHEAQECGEALLASSKTAVFTAAGGQSSRLGIDAPKGTFSVSPIRGKSLFQLHAQKIAFMQKKFHVHIPWIIMVSETNRTQTEEFFKRNDFFGLRSDLIFFAEQTMLPAMDDRGRFFLKEKSRLYMSPGGHGGSFSTLKNSGAGAWLREIGIEKLFYFQVDNVLVKILDPVFLGYHMLNSCEMSSKCVKKRDPEEKIGVFVVEDGKITVVEYSELDSIVLEEGGDPRIELIAGNIAIHAINLDFASRITANELKLPFHIAHKKIPHIEPDGKFVEPDRPNGYKTETFIFDALKSTDRSIIMEVPRQEEFSPLKNRTGENSPDTVLRDQQLLFADWFESAGIRVPRRPDGTPLYRLEVSPLFAPFRDDFVSKIGEDTVLVGDACIEDSEG